LILQEKCKKRQEAEESLKDEENAKRQKIEELLRVVPASGQSINHS
jgi:hypothetical protein